MIDKINFFDEILKMNYVALELGCGNVKKNIDSIGIDIINYDSVDLVGDATNILKKIPDNSIDLIYSRHFLEHVVDFHVLMDEISRILKKDGILEFVVPHFSNPYYYSDITHKNFFGLYSMNYFAHDMTKMKRLVPFYNKQIKFNLVSVDLSYQTYSKNIIFRAYKKIIT